jgi:hypothetical protein
LYGTLWSKVRIMRVFKPGEDGSPVEISLEEWRGKKKEIPFCKLE